MNKKLSTKELLIVGVCLIILGDLAGSYLGSAGGLLSGLVVLGGFICLLVAPFNIKKRNNGKIDSSKQISSISRKWGDLE